MGSVQLSRRYGARALGTAVAVVWLVAAALPARAQGSSEHDRARTISVSGTASVSASPDLAVVRLGVEARNGDAGKAVQEAAARSKAIVNALEGDGVSAKDIRTVDYSIGFVQTPQGGAARSGGSGGPAAGYYRVSDIAAVTVRNLANLGRILDDALSAGANEVQGVSFRLSNPAALEKEARAMAFRDAHAKAEQIAALAGEKLGVLLHATVGGSPAPQASGGFRAAALAAPAVNPGTLEVEVTLQVVYRIGK